MKRKKRIWLWALLLVLAAAAAAVIWQWNNLRTVHAVLTTDNQTAAQDLETQREKEQALLDRYDIKVNVPTVQQRDDLLKGKTDAQELKQQLGLLPEGGPASGESDPAVRPEAGEAGGTGDSAADPAEAPAGPAQDDPAARANALVEDCARSLYGLQVDLLEQLSFIRQNTLEEWTALSPAERTSVRKLTLISDGLNQCEALEKQADADVRALLDTCRAELSALGAPTDIIDELWESYSKEKQASRTYFLSQYL